MRIPALLVLVLVSTGLAAAEPAPVPGATAPRLFLGVVLRDGAGFDPASGLEVVEVVPGSACDRLGLRPGDRLLSLDGAPMPTTDAFRAATASLRPGQPVRFEVRRDDAPLSLSGPLAAPPRPREVMVEGARLQAEIAALRADGERARLRSGLEDQLRLLTEFEQRLPAVAAEFKRLYPRGTFSIQVHIDIRSDPADAQQVALSPAATAAGSATRPATASP